MRFIEFGLIFSMAAMQSSLYNFISDKSTSPNSIECHILIY